MMKNTEPTERIHKVISNRQLAPGTHVIRFERKELVFHSGQHLSLGPSDSIHRREYSIYSAPKADYLEILVREVAQGFISPKLCRLKPGDLLEVEGPFGFFSVPDTKNDPLVFLASGTGIAPFHSMILSNPEKNYRLIHGTRYRSEAYDHQDYRPEALLHCTSKDSAGPYPGRLSAWLREGNINPKAYYLLCGNCDMIYEAYDILSSAGLDRSRIQAEVYF